jgi:(p)ppGpp synthase/HD superfamily hydrolase
MSTLERAICIAAEAHQGQTDKANAPYILHVLRVMLSMTSDADRIVAVLHDLVEDTPWTLDALRAEGFGDEIIAAIDCMTRRDGEAYDTFIQRVSTNAISRRVKLADLTDNANLARIQAPTEQDRARVAKYERAIQVLTEPGILTGAPITLTGFGG